jgi:AAA+ superfamily predicted ATPase
VNVLLRELETFSGVVIFATNLAANFDPAFERRLRTHVLFQMPGVDEREQIWRVQMHPTLTPLAADVDFRALAERHEGSGGDIRNAVLKAAMAAAAEPGRDALKAIHQRHLEDGILQVLAAKRVMRQSLFVPDAPPPLGNPSALWHIFQAGAGSSLTISILAMALALLALVFALIR